MSMWRNKQRLCNLLYTYLFILFEVLYYITVYVDIFFMVTCSSNEFIEVARTVIVLNIWIYIFHEIFGFKFTEVNLEKAFILLFLNVNKIVSFSALHYKIKSKKQQQQKLINGWCAAVLFHKFCVQGESWQELRQVCWRTQAFVVPLEDHSLYFQDAEKNSSLQFRCSVHLNAFFIVLAKELSGKLMELFIVTDCCSFCLKQTL